MPANAFRTSWFAHCADCFGKENYTSILVTMETGLIIGRKLTLGPTYFLIPQSNYLGVFILSGIFLLALIPLNLAIRTIPNGVSN